MNYGTVTNATTVLHPCDGTSTCGKFGLPCKAATSHIAI